MPCFHPLKGFIVGVTPAGKRSLRVCGYGTDHVELQRGLYVPVDLPGRSSFCERMFTEWIELPCGHCDGCRIDRSRDWANRCMMEMEYHTDAYFLTLTYNDVFVPRAWYPDPATGEAFCSLTLRKRDWQLFMKRLRKNTGQDLRFYMCGEYGPKTFRPHYHAIVFGLHLDDLKFFSQRQLGDKIYNYYTSETVQRAWSVLKCKCEDSTASKNAGEVSPPDFWDDHDPLGHILVGQVTWETCAYTARYVMKKQYGKDAAVYEAHNIEPEFTLMSRRPGIGHQWYEDHPDCYDFDYINLAGPDGGRKIRPPKYFDKLFDVDDHERMSQIKETRQRFAEEQKKKMLQDSTLTYEEILANKERVFKDRIKTLRRDVL